MENLIGIATMLIDNFLFSLNLFKNVSQIFEPESNEYVLVQNWLKKLTDYDCTDPNDRLERNAYLNLLSLCLMNGNLHFPFTCMPQEGKLQDIYGSGESSEASSLRSQGCSICGLRQCLHFSANSENPLHETESVFLENFSENNIQSVSQENLLDFGNLVFDSSDREWVTCTDTSTEMSERTLDVTNGTVHPLWKRASSLGSDSSASDRSFPEDNCTENVFEYCSSLSSSASAVQKSTGMAEPQASDRTFREEKSIEYVFPSCSSPISSSFVVNNSTENTGSKNSGRLLYESATTDRTANDFPFLERESQDARPSSSGQLIPHTQYLQPSVMDEPKSISTLQEDHLNRTISIITVNSCKSGNCDCITKSDAFGEKEYEKRIETLIYNLLRDIRAEVHGKMPPGRNSYFDHLLSRYKDLIAKLNTDAAILAANRSGRKLRTFMLLNLRKDVEQFAKDIFASDRTSRAQNNITSVFPFSEIEPKNVRSSLRGSTVVDEPKSTTYLHEDHLKPTISITTVNSCKSGNCDCATKRGVLGKKEYEELLKIVLHNLLTDIRAEVHGKVPAGRNSYFDPLLTVYKEFYAKCHKDAAILAAIHCEQSLRSFLLLNIKKDLEQLVKDMSASDWTSRAQNNTTSVYSFSKIEPINARSSLHGSVVADEPKSTTFLHEDHLKPTISITTVNSCKSGNCDCATKRGVLGKKEYEELLKIVLHNLLTHIRAEVHGKVAAGRNSYFDPLLTVYKEFYAKYHKDAAILAAIHCEQSLRSFLLLNLKKDLEQLAKDISVSDLTSRAQNNITSVYSFSKIEPKNAKSSLHGYVVADEPKSTTYLRKDDLNPKISITTVNSCKSGNCDCVTKSEIFREREYEKRMQIFIYSLLRDIRAEVHGKVPAGRNSYFDYILSCYQEFFAKFSQDAKLLAAIHNDQTRRSFLLLNLQKDLKQLAKDIAASDRAYRAQNKTTSVYSFSEIEKKNAIYSLHDSVVVDEPKSTKCLHEDHVSPNISITTLNSCKCGNCNCITKNEVLGDKYVQKSANLEEDEELLQILIHNLLRDIHAELHGNVPAGRNSYFDLQLCLYKDFFGKYNEDAATLSTLHSERSLRSFLLLNLQKDLEKLAKDSYDYF